MFASGRNGESDTANFMSNNETTAQLEFGSPLFLVHSPWLFAALLHSAIALLKLFFQELHYCKSCSWQKREVVCCITPAITPDSSGRSMHPRSRGSLRLAQGNRAGQ